MTNVELFGHPGFPANGDIAGLGRYRAMLDGYGLHAGGWHGGMSEANWDARIAAAKRLGADYIGSGGFPGPGHQQLRQHAARRPGPQPARQALGRGRPRPGVLPQPPEGVPNQYVDDGVLKPAIDIVMERTDGRYVVAEIDVKWSSDALDDVTGTLTAAFINSDYRGASRCCTSRTAWTSRRRARGRRRTAPPAG